jgi:hypothetical protein
MGMYVRATQYSSTKSQPERFPMVGRRIFPEDRLIA